MKYGGYLNKLFQRICEAEEVIISKLKDNAWEEVLFDGEEFALLKEGETYNFQFKEIFPEDAGKYKVISIRHMHLRFFVKNFLTQKAIKIKHCVKAIQ